MTKEQQTNEDLLTWINGDFEAVISVICALSNHPRSLILSKCKVQPAPLWRQIAVKLLTDAGYNHKAITLAFGWARGSTQHALTAITNRIDKEPLVAKKYQLAASLFSEREERK